MLFEFLVGNLLACSRIIEDMMVSKGMATNSTVVPGNHSLRKDLNNNKEKVKKTMGTFGLHVCNRNGFPWFYLELCRVRPSNASSKSWPFRIEYMRWMVLMNEFDRNCLPFGPSTAFHLRPNNLLLNL